MDLILIILLISVFASEIGKLIDWMISRYAKVMKAREDHVSYGAIRQLRQQIRQEEMTKVLRLYLLHNGNKEAILAECKTNVQLWKELIEEIEHEQ